MKLFITGATGFIGSAYLAAAIAAGHEVAVLARETSSWRLRPFAGLYTHFAANLGDIEAIRQALLQFTPDAVVHLAWAGVSGRDRNAPLQIDNIGWSAALMLASHEAGVQHFIATGSQAEYGPKSGIIEPAAFTEPTTLYGEAKLATFRLLSRMAQDRAMRFSWLRVFSTYGPGDHPYWMIPTLIGSLLAAKRPALTPGGQKWDFLHVADAAEALLAVSQSGTADGVYNLGSGSAPPLRETISIIRDAIDPALPLGFGDIPYRPDQVMHLEADISRLKEDVSWMPRIDLAEGLVETVNWYRENQWIFSQ